ncbi:MAG: hypothetical protein O3A51_01700 [Verrucomicrobia bacterium]|nr:hypothetical protein [Verrucomicrobiota bacterium]
MRERNERVDGVQEAVSDRVMETADKIDQWLDRSITPQSQERNETFDRFFGDRRIDDERQGSRIRIIPEVEFAERNEIDVGVRFKARLSLPRVEDRINLSIDNLDDDKTVLEGFTDQRSRESQVTEDNETASLNFRLIDSVRFKSSISAGAKFKPEPIPRLKIKGGVITTRDAWALRLTENLFWLSDDGFGEKTQLDLDYTVEPQKFIRASTSVVWSEISEGVNAGQTLAYYSQLSQRRHMAILLGAIGHSRPSYVMDNYLFRFHWRQLIHSDWFHIEVEPGVDFPAERDWRFTPVLNLRFEFGFGDTDDN